MSSHTNNSFLLPLATGAAFVVPVFFIFQKKINNEGVQAGITDLLFKIDV